MKKILRKLPTSNFQLPTRLRGQGGVALLELLVAVSIFSATISVVVAVFISMAAAQKRSANAVNIDNSAYFALETIAKEVRTGKDFDFTCEWLDIDSYCSDLGFTNYHGQNVVYRLSASNAIEKSVDGGLSFNAITPASINVRDLKFNMIGQNPGGAPDGQQARITISFIAETPAGTPIQSARSINLQTTISSRNSDM